MCERLLSKSKSLGFSSSSRRDPSNSDGCVRTSALTIARCSLAKFQTDGTAPGPSDGTGSDPSATSAIDVAARSEDFWNWVCSVGNVGNVGVALRIRPNAGDATRASPSATRSGSCGGDGGAPAFAPPPDSSRAFVFVAFVLVASDAFFAALDASLTAAASPKYASTTGSTCRNSVGRYLPSDASPVR